MSSSPTSSERPRRAGGRRPARLRSLLARLFGGAPKPKASKSQRGKRTAADAGAKANGRESETGAKARNGTPAAAGAAPAKARKASGGTARKAGARGAQRAKARRPRSRRPGLVAGLASLALSATAVGSATVAAALFYFMHGMPGLDELSIPKRAPSITIMSASGEIMGRRGTIHAGRIGVSELPEHLLEAVLATEDRRFYEHFGVDFIGIARAAWVNFRAGRTLQGASTLTQQLAKNLFLSPERSIKRKVQEAVLALRLENTYSKDEILEIYLNRVYFGAGTYGIEAAAERYFEKSARDVTLGEAAMLAGLLKAPSRYAPTTNQDRAVRRAIVVLDAMQEAGFITSEERFVSEQTLKTPTARSNEHEIAPYILDWVAESLTEVLGEPRGDLVVETTIDLKLQAAALDAARKIVETEGADKKVGQAAVVLMDNNGATRALVGGLDYDTSQFNRAVKGLRQPGSTFKTFVYLAAMEAGYTPFDERYDEPVRIGDWEPHNYSQKYRGLVTLTEGLGRSINTIAAQIGDEVGMQSVVNVARRLGITSPLHANPSLALGTGEVSLFELTGAFAPLANGGMGVTPHLIHRVYSERGQVLYERHGSETIPVISHEDVVKMNYMLTGVMAWGTGGKARLEGHHAAGKTGTTQDYRDAWFIGYTGHYTAGVWVGNDDNSPMNRVTGGSLPAQIWKEVMTVAHEGREPASLPVDVTPPAPAMAMRETYTPSAPSAPTGWFGRLFGLGGEPAARRRAPEPVPSPTYVARSPHEGPPVPTGGRYSAGGTDRYGSGYSYDQRRDIYGRADTGQRTDAYGRPVDAYGRPAETVTRTDAYGRPVDAYGRAVDPYGRAVEPQQRRGSTSAYPPSANDPGFLAPRRNQPTAERPRSKTRVFNSARDRRAYEARMRALRQQN